MWGTEIGSQLLYATRHQIHTQLHRGCSYFMFLCLLVPSQKEMMRIFSMIKSGLCLARLNHPLTCWSPLKDYDEHVLMDQIVLHLGI